ncbi:MAG: type IIA DNA topoisomerase subunit B [Zoogloeaceae bacterium]|jgi:topoisomerase-4 subunit B|nr:type IIA DNA topoisomerase subunit B [Zoogloeaceae bacterium]
MSYNAESIAVLKGLEPVRHRPGMYTRTDCPLHIIQEAIDNAADEALAGFCRGIAVTLHSDGSVTVEDDGRGIPVEIHPAEGVPTVEIVFTHLHAGGKFNKTDEGAAYRFSGGLHGVGVSVTNALSSRLEVEVMRGGVCHRLVFANGAVSEPLRQVSSPTPGVLGKKKNGTRARIWPDARFFDTPEIPIHDLERLLRSKAVLLPGLEVHLHVEGGDLSQNRVWRFSGGLRQYLAERLSSPQSSVFSSSNLFDKESLLYQNNVLDSQDGTPLAIFAAEKYVTEQDETFAQGAGAAWALSWTSEGALARESYVNLIPTPAGGTHEAGLRQAAFEAMRSFTEHHALLPKGVKLAAEDVFARLNFVLAARLLDPSFQGQTKERLISRDALPLMARMLRDPLELWLNENPETAKAIAEMAIRAAQARSRAGQKVEKKKQSGVAVLPGKLSDCQSEDLGRNELFLVEGDSAGGSAKSGRDKETQAILPLRGKVLNTWEIDADNLFANREIHDVSVALGIDPHGPDADDAVLSGLRYGKVIVMTDADVDGSHIRVLLATLFYRHFPRLVARGHLYFAQPPLYRLDVPGQGKRRPPLKIYALDAEERDAALQKLAKEHIRVSEVSVSRFKGLGEMNPEQLWETTMCPDTRRLLRVRFPEARAALPVMNMLMGKNEAAGRRAWMEKNGAAVGAEG